MRILFILFISFCAAHAQKFTPQALLKVNSLYDEQNPVISPDGNTLYFTVVGHPQNVEGKKAVGDIWFSRWEGTRWSVPIHAGSEINTSSFNSIAGFSPDGNQLVLMNHYNATSQGIAISKRTNEGWSAPENIRIPYFLNKSLLVSGFVSDDGNVLVYAAEGYETRGVEDLYVSFKDESGRWSEPKNLGSSVNTGFQEITPSLSADKKTLYFSSNRPNGFGSFDVYSSKRLDETWTNWSKPENMGASINTEGRELYFRMFHNDSLTLYTTTHNSNEYGDIKLYNESERPDAPKQPAPVSVNPAFITLTGKVVNAKTGNPIEARLSAKADSTYLGSSTVSGYELLVKPTKVYTLKVEAAGYITALEKIDLTRLTSKKIELNVKLQPIEVGVNVNLKSVLFKVSETTLLPESYDELNTVVDLMKSNPNVEIELGGHTDSRGDARLNQRLSQGRVDKVKAYLISKGINGNRIQGKGYGGKKPIAQGDSEESRKLNRRVEFTIVKD